MLKPRKSGSDYRLDRHHGRDGRAPRDQQRSTQAIRIGRADRNSHNAAFDLKVAERHWPIFARHHWACSATGIDWKAHGFRGARLAYLPAEYGLFHDAHRALDDCHAVLEISARDVPGTEQSALAILLDRARRPQYRIWTIDAPLALKAVLKERGYRWNDGADGRPRSWYADVDACDAELKYLRKEIYQRPDADLMTRKVTSLSVLEPNLTLLRSCASVTIVLRDDSVTNDISGAWD